MRPPHRIGAPRASGDGPRGLDETRIVAANRGHLTRGPAFADESAMPTTLKPRKVITRRAAGAPPASPEPRTFAPPLRFPGKPADRADQPRANVAVYASSAEASAAVAGELAGLIRERQRQQRKAVLGLATGSTPQGLYDELVRLHRDEGLSFENVVTFNLDEYWPMDPAALQSYHRFMAEALFDHVDIRRENIHIPDGRLAQEDIPSFCAEYERAIRDAGGIDCQILGIGRTGHVGFNEPGSPRDSRTRLITLDRVTRMDAASDFFGERHVPRRAITLGVGTIMEARRIVLMGFGEGKAPILRRAIEGDVTPAVAASYLQQHANAEFVLDRAAASELTAVKTPWLLGPIAQFGGAWDRATTRRAVIWLALQLNKPILKLVEEDYNEHGLQELISARGSAYDLNIEVFRGLQQTITGWPGGKPPGDRRNNGTASAKEADRRMPALSTDRAVRRQAARNRGGDDVFPKRVVVFSPHPDDDVISMGGTLIRLCEQGHDVHVAYQTSGCIAVWDEEAARYADFVAEFCDLFSPVAERQAGSIQDAIGRFLKRKKPGDVDTPELQKIKALIRRSEARAAAIYAGVQPQNIHFLDMPFYETGRVRKQKLSDADVVILCGLLDRVRPHQVYAAGDLSDPHGTHRVCLAAIDMALARLAGRPWHAGCALWHYRGAWQEWEPHEIDMAVPLSPDEVDRKRMAIFRHQSQKDKALFPGPSDPREFWQRAEDRNRNTAVLYDKLGLPEYQALEAFVLKRPAKASE